jgi:hypothetical protein
MKGYLVLTFTCEWTEGWWAEKIGKWGKGEEGIAHVSDSDVCQILEGENYRF